MSRSASAGPGSLTDADPACPTAASAAQGQSLWGPSRHMGDAAGEGEGQGEGAGDTDAEREKAEEEGGEEGMPSSGSVVV